MGAVLLGVGTPAWSIPATTLLGAWLAAGAIVGDARGDVARGALVGAIAHGVALRWLPGAWADIGSGGPLVWAAASALGALPVAVGFGLAGAAVGRGMARPIAVASAWAAGEALAGFTPVPLGLTAGLAATPALAAAAAWGGRPLLAGLLGWIVARPASVLAGVAAVVWLGLSAVVGTGGDTARWVAVVQTNVGRFDDRPSQVWDRARRVTEGANAPVDLVVTPEGSWPWGSADTDRGARSFVESWRGLPPTLLGVLDGTNGVDLVVEGVVADRVAKRTLVPLWETRWLGLGNAAFVPGDGDGTLRVGDVRVAVLVCWEDIVRRALVGVPGDVGLLALPSSDVRLGPVGARQHLDGARYAAIETGRWAARAARTGTSGFIDPRGRIHDALPWLERGEVQVAIHEVPLRGGGWTGARAGLFVGVLGFGVAVGGRRRARDVRA